MCFLLSACLQLHTLFVGFDALLEDGEYAKACASVDRVSQLIAQLVGSSVSDSRVVAAVRNQARKQRTRARARLSELFARAVVVDANEIKVMKEVTGALAHTHFDRPARVGAIVRCLEALGLLDERMRELAVAIRSTIVAKVASGEVCFSIPFRT